MLPAHSMSCCRCVCWQYELCVRSFRGARPSSSQGEAALPPHLLMMAGGIAGTVQWLPPFYCADVLKSRMQSAAPGVYSSVWDCAVKSYRSVADARRLTGLSTPR